MADTDENPPDLPSMGKALTIIESNLVDRVFREARLQYETLISMRDAHYSKRAYATRAQQSINLPRFYYELFNSATSDLDEWGRHRLLTICLAYKTKAAVLLFLERLDVERISWAERFIIIVRSCGRDTLFADDAITSNEEAEKPKKHIGHDFVIPTLCLAYPEKFFTLLGHHAPLHTLTSLTSLYFLSYPSALLLDYSDSMTRVLVDNIWRDRICQTVDENEREALIGLFDHLFEAGHESLTTPDGNELAAEVGYEAEDLAIWVASWSAYRQKEGNVEEGQRVRLRLRLGLDSRYSDERAVEENGDSDLDDGVEDYSGQSVWWEDRLEDVREISPRPQKIRKGRKSTR